MANRDQILEPVFVRSLDQRDDVALFDLPKNDLAVRGARALLPERLAGLITLFFDETRYFCHRTLVL